MSIEKKHILLLEDSSGEAKGIMQRLSEIQEYDINVTWIDTCDEALETCTKTSFDLVIVDLHYKDEGLDTTIEDGEDFIIQLRKTVKNAPPVVVYSMIQQPVTLDLLVNVIGVDAYIVKGRRSLDELAYSLNLILIGGQYISKEVKQILERNKNAMNITRMDRAILRKLYQGAKINQLPDLLKKDGFTSCGQATIENRIKDLKEYFEASTTLQLVALAKEKKVFSI